jgi:large subunit ribosomal protein L6
VSRIGRMPVEVPAGVNVEIQGSHVKVKGPKGELSWTFSPMIEVSLEDGQVIVKRSSEEKIQRALHGTTRALISNMVTGVSTGFERVLEIDGVGYRAEMSGSNLTLFVGYSHPVVVTPPPGITFDVDTRARQIKIRGFDKAQVGQVAADIREVRPPEPYKGKGIRYQGEKIRRKAGKSGKAKK